MDCQIIWILKVSKAPVGEDQVLEVPTPKHTINRTILDDKNIYDLLIMQSFFLMKQVDF